MSSRVLIGIGALLLLDVSPISALLFALVADLFCGPRYPDPDPDPED